MRWQIFGARDLISDARGESDPVQRAYLRKRAERSLAKAKANAEKLKALIDAEKAKGDEGDSLAVYTLAALQQQYDAYAKWLAEAVAAAEALEAETNTEPSNAVDEDATTEDAAAEANPPSQPRPASEFPTSDNLVRQSLLIMRVDAVLHDICLAQAHARATYYREGMGRRMKLAFNRHGGTGKHGWIWSWADSLWMHQYGYVSDGRYANFRIAAERFRAEVVQAQTITVGHLEYADTLVETLEPWREDIHNQYALLDQIIDLYGQCGSAGEKGDSAWAEKADAESKRLIERLNQPSPVQVKPFAP